MDLTLIRAKRTKEQNQERAYIAAARRTDRPFHQRLNSLQKASELHFARTGRRFKVDQEQLFSHKPLEEMEKGYQSPFYQRTFTSYPQPLDCFQHQSPNIVSPTIMFGTGTESPFSSAEIEHLAPGFDLFQPNFLSSQLNGSTYGKSQHLKEIEHELFPLIKMQNTGLNASQLPEKLQMGVMPSPSAVASSFFEQDQFKDIQHQLPKINKEYKQNFITEYLLQHYRLV